MNITRENFEEMLPEIEKRIKKCNFICFDAEYTGLYTEDLKDGNSLFDTPEARYTKLKEKVVSKFSISQVGLAFYERNLDDQITYNVNAYNIYIFPVSFDTFSKREIISMQISCLNFLTRNNFDFNKFLKEGVPYMNREKAASLKKWLAANRHFMSTCEHLDKTYFPKRIEYLQNDEIDEIVDRLEGFSKIVKLMKKYKKPLVGHNMLNDILLMYQMFIAELPESYTDFKKNFHEIFPEVYDTKCIAWGLGDIRQSENPDDRVLSDTNLFTLYMNCSIILQTSLKPVILGLNETKEYQDALIKGTKSNLENLADAKCHTAGFDATVTGAVLLKLGYLASRRNDVPEYKQGLAPTMTEMFKRLGEWKDEVNIGRCVVSNIHLSNPDPPSKRPDWIRVKSVPGKTKPTVDPFWLRGQLVKYGDIEIEVVKPDEVNIACGGIGCAKRVWKDLEKKGFKLSSIKIPVISPQIKSRSIQACTVISILIAAFLLYRKKL